MIVTRLPRELASSGLKIRSADSSFASSYEFLSRTKTVCQIAGRPSSISCLFRESDTSHITTAAHGGASQSEAAEHHCPCFWLRTSTRAEIVELERVARLSKSRADDLRIRSSRVQDTPIGLATNLVPLGKLSSLMI